MIYRSILGYDAAKALKPLVTLGEFVTVLGKLFWVSRIEKPVSREHEPHGQLTFIHLEEHDELPEGDTARELKFRPEWDFIYHMKDGSVVDIVGDCFKKVV